MSRNCYGTPEDMESKDDIQQKIIAFRSDGYIYYIVVAANVDDPELWQDAQYFLETIKIGQ